MVDFESRVYGAVESDAHGQYGHGQVRVAARVGREYQRYRRAELTWKHENQSRDLHLDDVVTSFPAPSPNERFRSGNLA